MKFLKTKLLRFFLALALVFSAILPYNALTVKADDNPPVEGTLYYYGDCSTRQSFLQSVIQTVDYNYCSSVYDIPDAIDEDIDEISDSFIIVEFVYDLKYDLPQTNVNWLIEGGAQRNNDLLSGLENCFETLKNNNNQIMFICDTDEELYATHRDFLDYVDIHVNKDIMTPLARQILYDASVATCDDGSGKLADCTFLISQSFLDSNSPFPYLTYNSDLLGFYFLSYFWNVYNEELPQNDYNIYDIVELNYKVKIFIQTGDNTFGSNDWGTATTTGDYFYEQIENDYIRTIGSSLDGATVLYDWFDMIIEARERFGLNHEDIPDYIYNENACSLANYTENTIYSIGELLASFESTLSTIIRDFVNQADLNVYNNWSARCPVTYKPLPAEGNGWFRNIFAETGIAVFAQVAYKEE